MSDKIKLFILVNQDLRLTPGQIAAQVSHVTHQLVDTLVRIGYESHPIPQCYIDYMVWSSDPITIVKKASAAEISKFKSLDKAIVFSDKIFNKQKNSHIEALTAVAFYPGSISADEMAVYDLL